MANLSVTLAAAAAGATNANAVPVEIHVHLAPAEALILGRIHTQLVANGTIAGNAGYEETIKYALANFA